MCKKSKTASNSPRVRLDHYRLFLLATSCSIQKVLLLKLFIIPIMYKLVISEYYFMSMYNNYMKRTYNFI